MKHFSFILLLAGSISCYAQKTITGIVFDESDKPLAGANVYLKNTYTGCTSDSLGIFAFINNTHSNILVISFIGYKTRENEIDTTITQYQVKLHLSSDNLEEIVITASSFAAGDKKRAVLLSSLEVATTAGSDADIYAALSTFPGATKQGETGEIIVRGGDINESKTFMDGLLISSPYTSTMPDIPARSKFSPFMFSGIMFSTGGYSAEYGQALSSVLELDTPGLFDEDVTSISIQNLGVGVSHTKRNLRSAYSGGITYNNLAPYFSMAQHHPDWEKTPVSINADLKFRNQIGKTGLLKTFFNYRNGSSILKYQSSDSDANRISMQNANLYFSAGYNAQLNHTWLLKTGVTFSIDNDNKNINSDKVNDHLKSVFARLGFIKSVNPFINLKIGSDFYQTKKDFKYYNDSIQQSYPFSTNDLLTSGYIEGEIRLAKKIALRTGLRAENSSYSKETKVVPRLSIAYQVNPQQQVSGAYGIYNQQPPNEYMLYVNELEGEKATHYILSYLFQTNNRIFRAEIYHKSYDRLATYTTGSDIPYKNLSNKGRGYANGLDIFWRDNKSIQDIEYWISYSYIDSKRIYKDYPTKVTPNYLSAHNLSVIAKCFIDKINSQLAFSYNYRSGRPYNNPNHAAFMDCQTKPVHDLSGNISFLTNLFGNFTIVHVAVNNILGLEKTYSYRYTYDEENQQYVSAPVKDMMGRTIYIGIFISIK
jgi:vitamin B12 transporter